MVKKSEEGKRLYVLTESWIYELCLVGIDRVKNKEGESVKTGTRDRKNKEGIDFDGRENIQE